MKTITSKKELAEILDPVRFNHNTIGFVPTMGALHEGHLSLISASRAANDLTVCSIFVNPTQFTDARDLELYPRPIEKDTAMLTRAGADILFLPSAEEMYSAGETWEIELGGIADLLEGKFRPGHFNGVTQIVYKLFKLVGPDRAYFGQKDFQQFTVIRKMVELKSLSVELVRCPVIREADGLAMSSRNIRLGPEYRIAALNISRALRQAAADRSLYSVAETISRALSLLEESQLIRPEYFSIADAETLLPVTEWDQAQNIIALVAVKAGEVRLIDNQYLKELEIYS